MTKELAIKILSGEVLGTNEQTNDAAKLAIKAITAQRWIPVTERLPKEGRYLVSRHDYVTKTNFIDILWYEKNVWWNRRFTGNFSVFAWMPLPDPWEGEEDDSTLP